MAISMSAGALRGARAVEAGGATESAGGLAAIVLTVIALCGVMTVPLTAIAGIVFGLAFMVEGAAIAARQSAIMSQAAGQTAIAGAEVPEIGGGVTVELVAGLASVILGILSLVGIAPWVLLPALTTVGGAAVILSAGAAQRLNEVQASLETPNATVQGQAIARMALSGAANSQFLAGVAVVVLGIVGLVRVGDPVILSAVGILVLGAAITLSGTALASRMLKLFRS
jgi:hypothetical protein